MLALAEGAPRKLLSHAKNARAGGGAAKGIKHGYGHRGLPRGVTIDGHQLARFMRDRPRTKHQHTPGAIKGWESGHFGVNIEGAIKNEDLDWSNYQRTFNGFQPPKEKKKKKKPSVPEHTWVAAGGDEQSRQFNAFQPQEEAQFQQQEPAPGVDPVMMNQLASLQSAAQTNAQYMGPQGGSTVPFGQQPVAQPVAQPVVQQPEMTYEPVPTPSEADMEAQFSTEMESQATQVPLGPALLPSAAEPEPAPAAAAGGNDEMAALEAQLAQMKEENAQLQQSMGR